MTVRRLRLLALLLAAATAGSLLLPWIDTGERALAERLSSRPGYEDARERVSQPEASGLDTPLGPFVLVAAALGTVAAALAWRLGARGKGERARGASAAGFACLVVAAILSATTLLRGPGRGGMSSFGIPVQPSFAYGVFVAVALASAGAVACAAVVARSTPPRPPPPS